MAAAPELFARVCDASQPTEARAKAASEIKALCLDQTLASNNTAWVQTFVKPCCDALAAVPPALEDAGIAKTRGILVEVLMRTPQGDAAKASAADIFAALLSVAQKDVTENASNATKYMFELLKGYKGAMEAQAHQFLEFGQQLFSNLPELVRLHLEDPSPGAPPPEKPPPIPGTQSFKYLQEWPNHFFYTLQQLPQLVPAHLEKTTSILLQAVTTPAPPLASLHPSRISAAADLRVVQTKSLTVMWHVGRNKPEQMRAHVAAMADAYILLLRESPSAVNPRKDLINLMRQIFSSNTPMREALRGYVGDLMDDRVLFGAAAAANQASAITEFLRFPAYQAALEMMHHMRKFLTPAQVLQSMAFAEAGLANNALSTGIHTLCVRILSSMSEVVVVHCKNATIDMESKVKMRAGITRALHSYGARINQLRQAVPKLLADAKAERAGLEQKRAAVTKPASTSSSAFSDTAADAAPAQPSASQAPDAPAAGAAGSASSSDGSGKAPLLHQLQLQGDKEKEALECKQLALFISQCIKTIILVGNTLHHSFQKSLAVQQQQQQGAAPAQLPPLPEGIPAGFTEEELRALSRLWINGLRCLKLVSYQNEAREVCEKFADAYCTLDPKDFVEVIGGRLHDMFNAVLEDPELMHTVAHMLLHAVQGRSFCLLLLEYMTSPTRLALLENVHSKEGAAVVKLVKLLLPSLGNYEDLDQLVAPQIVRLVEHCMRCATRSNQPLGYLQIVRAVFKAANPQTPYNSKLRACQQELAPHLSNYLHCFNTWLLGPNVGNLRVSLVELCLMLPVQMSGLIPLLPRMARPLLNALSQGPDELIVLGLRTLEVWVDNFNPEYVEVAISEVAYDMNAALWALMKPTTLNVAVRVASILGKLGGRNRRFLKEPQQLEYKDNPEYGLRLILTFRPTLSFLTPLDKCMVLAKQALLASQTLGDANNDLHYRKQALRFLQVCLASVLNLRLFDVGEAGSAPGGSAPPGTGSGSQEAAAQQQQDPTDPAQQEAAVDRLLEVLLGQGPVPAVPPMPAKADSGTGVKTKVQLQAERNVLVALLSAILAAAADEKLADVASPFARNMCRHFGMLFAAGTQPPPPAPAVFRHEARTEPQSAPAMPQGLRELDIHLFLDALIEVLCDKAPARARAALDGLATFLDTLLMLHEAKSKIGKPADAAQPGDGAGPAAMDVAAPPASAAQGDGRSQQQQPTASEQAATAGQDQQQKGSGEGGTADGSAQAQQQKPPEARTPSARLSKAERPAAATALGLPGVLDELYLRILHCCCDDSWHARLAGAAAVKLLVHHPLLPPEYLQHWAPHTSRALLFIIRALPAHSVVEQDELDTTLVAFMRRTLLQEHPRDLKARDKKHREASGNHGSAPADSQAAKDGEAAPPADGGAARGEDAAGTSGVDAPPGVKVDGSASWVQGLGSVLLNCILTAPSTSRMRASAVKGVSLLASAIPGSSEPDLVSAYLAEHTKDDMKDFGSRRLLPLQSVNHAIGVAEAATWVLSLRPALSAWGSDLSVLVNDAMWIAELDETRLLARLPISRSTSAEGLTRLRVACMKLLCAVMQREEFQGEPKEPRPAGESTPTAEGASEAPTPVPEAPGGPSPASAGKDSAPPSAGTTPAPQPPPGQTPAEAAQDKPKLTDPALRRQMTVIFFNNLTSSNEDICMAARQGVKVLVSSVKLDKQTTHHALRPHIKDLGDHRKLTVTMLQELSRLLEEAAQWFSPALMAKLMEHLMKWASPEGPAAQPPGQPPVPVAWKPGEEIAVAAQLLDILHLSEQAGFFVEKEGRPSIVTLTLELEKRLPIVPSPQQMPTPHVMTSPYRLPLTRYLSKHATEAVQYFLNPARMANSRYTTLLHDILLLQPAAQPLLNAVAAAEEQLLPLLSLDLEGASQGTDAQAMQVDGQPSQAKVKDAAPFEAVRLVKLIAKLKSGWFAEHPRIVAALRARWASPGRITRMEAPADLPESQAREPQRLAKCLLTHVDLSRGDLPTFFDIFSICQAKISDKTFLEQYCSQTVAKQWAPAERRTVLEAVVGDFKAAKRSQEELDRLLTVLFLPVMSHALEEGGDDGSQVVDAALVEAVATDMLGLGQISTSQPGDGREEGPSSNDTTAHLGDALQISLLRITTLILKHKPALFGPAHSKALVSFFWRHLRRDNQNVVSHAYLAIAQYMAVKPSPERISLQILGWLLRAHQTEVKRPLVREALDLLLPVLHEGRFTPSSDGGAGSPASTPSAAGPGAGGSLEPHWVRVIRKALTEEQGSYTQQMHVWQVILRNADILYPHRAHFVPSMVPIIARMFQGGTNSHVDFRRVCLDLAAVMLAWEQRRQAEEPPARGGAQPKQEQQATGAAVEAGSKRAREDGDDQGAAKVAKTEATSTAPEAAAAAAAADQQAEGSQGSWQPERALVEQLASALVRFPLSLLHAADAAKDEETQVQISVAVRLLGELVQLWPNISFRFNYLERLLPTHMVQAQQQVQQNAAQPQAGPPCPPVPPILTCFLSMVKALTSVNSPSLLASYSSQIVHLIDPCCITKDPKCVQELGHILRSICGWQIPEGQPGHVEAGRVRRDLEGKLQVHLTQATGDYAPSGVPMTLANHPQVLSSLCCCLMLLESLQEVFTTQTMLLYMPLVVKALHKALRELNQQAQQTATIAAQQRRALPLLGNPSGEPEYGTLSWAIASCWRLCAPITLNHPEHHKNVLSTMVSLLVSQYARFIDPCLFLAVLGIVERWVLRPYPQQQGTLITKEIILLCQRLGLLEKQGILSNVEPTLRGKIEGAFLKLMHQLCTQPSLPQEVRDDVFMKVERMFMVGLKANKPEIRRDFFALYDKYVPATLFDRLQFILFSQEWEPMANQFWLKHALDLILAVLKEDEEILLAFNSSQVPPLLPGTKQNIFSPALHLTQQQQQQQQSVKQDPGKTEAQEPGATGVVKKEEPAPEGATGAGVQVKAEPESQGAVLGPGSDVPMPDAPTSTGGASSQQDAGAPQEPGGAQPMSLDGGEAAFRLTVPKDQVAPPVVQLVGSHAEFLRSMGQLRVRDMMQAVREYLHADSQMAYHLWVLMFPIVWATLEKQQQAALAKPIIALLSKEYHQKQTTHRPNIVQAMLDGIAVSQPQPKIPPELIKFLGKTFNAWQIATPLLESHVVMFPDDSRCFQALVELYKLVNEEDMMFGLWRKRCTTEVTRAALSLVQAGQLDRAEEVLGETMRMMAHGGMINVQPSRSESSLWVDQWISCAKALNHWDLLLEYSRATEQVELQADCLWRLQEWQPLKELLTSGRGALEDASSCSFLIRAYLTLNSEGDGGMACERFATQATNAALLRWWQLPEVVSSAQLPLLQTFQQLVEVRESVRILADLGAGGGRPDHPFQEVRDITGTWRLRVPNEWEPLTHWYDVLVWRNHIYNVIITNFRHLAEINPQLHQLGYRDKAWSVNKLGGIATTHGLPDTCLNILNTMYAYSAMEVQEAFVKIREQARAHLERPADLMAGFNLLNTTNLDYFGPPHQAEIFRFKGMFLTALKEWETAHHYFSISLYLWKQSAESWVAWGQLCDEQWEASLQQGRTPQPFILEYAIHSIIQGVRLGSAQARQLLPRLLSLLSFDNDSTQQQAATMPAGPGGAPNPGWQGAVWGAMQRGGAYELPAAVWLPWLRELTFSLVRPERAAVAPLLQQVALSLPQAPFYPLRAAQLGFREDITKAKLDMRVRHQQLKELNDQKTSLTDQLTAAEAAAQSAPDQGAAAATLKAKLEQVVRAIHMYTQSFHQMSLACQMEQNAYESVREISESVRSRYPALSATLETLCLELQGRFTARMEERLFSVVHALLHRCYKLPYASHAPVPQSMKEELGKMCRNMLSEARIGSGPLKDQLGKDLNPELPSFPATLGDLMDLLKGWRARLSSELEDKTSSVLRLEDESPTLRDLSLTDVEMPGIYSVLAGSGEGPTGLAASLPGGDGADVLQTAAPGVVLLEAIGSHVSIVRRAGSSHRRLMFYGSDGRVRHMSLLSSNSWSQQVIEERNMQLLRCFNRLLDAQPQSRARALAWYVPIHTPLAHFMRLVEEDPSFASYGEAYEVSCTRYGREADLPILHLKRRCSQSTTGVMVQDQTAYQLRLAAYNEICEKVVSENIFSQYIYKTLPSCNHLWVFKKAFCTQMALSGLLCHMLLLGGRAPLKILFAKNSGRVIQQELSTWYSDRGSLERLNEPVPFRLTRNMATFFTSFGVEGVFMAAMANAAQAILHKSGNAQHVLALFFRDDFSSWHAQKNKITAVVSAIKNEALKIVVNSNVRKTLERTRLVAPQPLSDEAMNLLFAQGGRSPVFAGVAELIELATNPKLLSRMEPTWHPWF